MVKFQNSILSSADHPGQFQFRLIAHQIGVCLISGNESAAVLASGIDTVKC